MSSTVRWNIAVSAETDRALRVLLAHQGGRKGDLSRFIEDAVRERLFDQTASLIKEENARYTPEQIDSAVEEALDWARGKLVLNSSPAPTRSRRFGVPAAIPSSSASCRGTESGR